VQVDAEVEAEVQPFFSVNMVSLVSISFIFIFLKFYFLYLYCFSVLFFERFFSFVLMSFRTCFSFMLSFDLFRRSAYCGILYAYFSCPVFVFFCPEVLFLFVWSSLEIIGVVFSFVSCHPVF